MNLPNAPCQVVRNLWYGVYLAGVPKGIPFWVYICSDRKASIVLDIRIRFSIFFNKISPQTSVTLELQRAFSFRSGKY